jgi:hypothetical protein
MRQIGLVLCADCSQSSPTDLSRAPIQGHGIVAKALLGPQDLNMDPLEVRDSQLVENSSGPE